MKKQIAAINIRQLLILIAVLVGSVFIGLAVGPVSNAGRELILRIRLPRVLMAAIVGGGLACAGAVFQGILKNPLADPFIIGTSSGAALGIALGTIAGKAIQPYTSYIGGIAGAFVVTLAVYRIARIRRHAPVETLILAGVIMSSFVSAMTMLVMSLFRREASEVYFFLMGTLQPYGRGVITITFIFVVIGALVSWFFARELNILSQGEETALHLGIEVEKVRRILFFSASMVVGSVVAASGMIGFVGLIIPHIVRLLTGPDHRTLIPNSILAGATLLILCDTLACTIARPVEIPVGIVTALCGAPFFVYLLLKRKRG